MRNNMAMPSLKSVQRPVSGRRYARRGYVATEASRYELSLAIRESMEPRVRTSVHLCVQLYGIV